MSPGYGIGNLHFRRRTGTYMKPANDLKPSRRKTTCKGTMDNHKVFCGLIIFLQIADLPRGSTYNFSICNHDEIQEDLLNVLDPLMTFNKEELQLDFHTCEDAPSPSASPQQSEGSRRAERAGRLLECVLERARGCGDRPPALWRSILSVVQRRCPNYRPPQGAAAGEASRIPCDESKARELMAVWRSYLNLG